MKKPALLLALIIAIAQLLSPLALVTLPIHIARARPEHRAIGYAKGPVVRTLTRACPTGNTLAASSAAYDARGNLYVAVGNKLITPEGVIKLPAGAWLCTNSPVLRIAGKLVVKHIAVSSASETVVVVAPHFGRPCVWREGEKSCTELASLPRTTYSYWIETDGQGHYYWLSANGLYAFDLDGSILWSDKTMRRGRLAVGDGKVAAADGARVKLYDALTGEVLEELDIPAISVKYSPSAGAFVVSTSDGSVYKIASPAIKLLQMQTSVLDVTLEHVPETGQWFVLAATPGGLFVWNNVTFAAEADETHLVESTRVQHPDNRSRAYVVVGGGHLGAYFSLLVNETLVTTLKVSKMSLSNFAHYYDNKTGTLRIAVVNPRCYEEIEVNVLRLLEEDLEPHIRVWGHATTSVYLTGEERRATIDLNPHATTEPYTYIYAMEVRVDEVYNLGSAAEVSIPPSDVSVEYYDFGSGPKLAELIKVFGVPHVAEAKSFWNVSVSENTLDVSVRVDGYWHDPLAPGIADAVPVASMGLFWLTKRPINPADFTELGVYGTIEVPGSMSRMENFLLIQDLLTFVALGFEFRGLYHEIKPVLLPKIRGRTLFSKATSSWADDFAKSLRSFGTEVKAKLSVKRFSDAIRALMRRGIRGETAAQTTKEAVTEASRAYLADRLTKELVVHESGLSRISGELLDHMTKAPQEVREAADAAADMLVDLAGTRDPVDFFTDLMKVYLRDAGEITEEGFTTVGHAVSRGSALLGALSRKRLIERGVPESEATEMAYRLGEWLRQTVIGREVVDSVSKNLPMEGVVVVPASTVASMLAAKLVDMGVPEEKAEEAAHEAAQIMTVEVVRVSTPTLVFDEVPEYFAGAAEAIIGLATGFLLDIAKDVEAIELGSLGGASFAVAVGVAAYYTASELIQSILFLINDLALYSEMQGSYTMGGVAAAVRFQNGTKKLVLFGSPPDKLLRHPAFKLFAIGSLEEWLDSALDDAAKSRGYDDAVIIDIAPSDLKTFCDRYGVSRIEKVGVFLMPIIWNRLPYPYTFQTYTATWKGRFRVSNFHIYGKRLVGRKEVAPEEVKEILADIIVETPKGDIRPCNYTERGAFFVVPLAKWVRFEAGPSLAGLSVRLNVTLYTVSIDHMEWSDSEALSGTIINRAPIEVTMEEVELAALPANMSPVTIYVEPLTSTGPAPTVTLCPEEFESTQFAGFLYMTTTFTSVFDPKRRGTLRQGEGFKVIVAYSEVEPVIKTEPSPKVDNQTQPSPEPTPIPGDSCVIVRLNGTLRWALLPSVASVYIYSPEPQAINLTLAYRIEVENATEWRVVESGTILEQTLSVGEGWVRRSYDIRQYTTRLIDVVNETGLPATLYIRVIIEPQVDRVSWNNWHEASVHYTPDQLQKVVVEGNYTLTVKTYDAVTGDPIEANVTVDGLSAVTTGGTASFILPAGTYTVTAYRTGYSNVTVSVVLNDNLTLGLPMTPLGEERPNQGNGTQPPIVINQTVYVPLQVKVTTRDGYPVFNATVYVNDTVVGYTDAWGMWMRYYKNGTLVHVKVAVPEKAWTSEVRSATLNNSLLYVFIAPWESGRTLPEVALLSVAALANTTSTGVVSLLVFAETSVPQNITVRAGLLYANETVAAYRDYNVSLPGVGLYPLVLPVNITARGRLIPFARIIAYEQDTNTTNNEVRGPAIFLRIPARLVIRVLYEYHSWLPAGVLYPERSWVNLTVVAVIDRPADFVSEFGRSVPVHVVVDHRWPEPAAAILDKRIDLKKMEKTEVVLATLNITVPKTRYITVNITLPAIEDLVGPGANRSLVLEVPPHFIVERSAVKANVVRIGDKVLIEVRAWSNARSEEMPSVRPLISFAEAPMVPLKPIDIEPGERDYRVEVRVPEIEFRFYEPVRTVNVTALWQATPDAYAGDNKMSGKVTVLNTGSWVFWLLVAGGIIMLLIIIFLVVSIIRGIVKAAVAHRPQYWVKSAITRAREHWRREEEKKEYWVREGEEESQ